MIARAHGDHIHSSRPDGAPDRCHGRPGCHPQGMSLERILGIERTVQGMVDSTMFSAEDARAVAARMRDDHAHRDWAEVLRNERAWLDAEIERVLGNEAFREALGLDAQGLYLQYGDDVIPVLRDTD